MKVSGDDLLTNVLGGGDGLAGPVGDRLAADIGSGEIAGSGDGFSPGEEIGRLLGEQPAAFFLIEE